MRTHGDEPGTIGVLVVHGIGAQERGQTLGKLLAGLRRVAPDGLPASPGDGAQGTLCGQPVRFYEVYWADLLKGEVTRGAFIMDELRSVAWFPWFNLWRGSYEKGHYGLPVLLWRFLTLPVVSTLLMLAWWGAQFVVRAVLAGWNARRPTERRSWGEGWRHATRRHSEHTPFDRLLDEYVGDVFTYVNSARNAFHRERRESPVPDAVRQAQAAIVARFHEQLVRARKDGCATIHVVAHSLGTVVMYHGLRGLGFGASGIDAREVRAAAAQVQHLYTIGSPLEKIRFLWPRLTTPENLAGRRRLAWDNFVSWFDPVAGMLRRYDEWGGVRNHRLLGGGFFRGHVVYEHSPVFLHALTEGLCGQALPLRRGWRERLGDASLLLGETVAAPAVLTGLLIAGALLLAATIALVPFLLSLPFRPFVAPEVWGPVLDRGFTVMAVMFITVMLTVPVIRASRVHRLFWSAESAPSDVSHGPAATAAERDG